MFNLALLLQRKGTYGDAGDYWRRYCDMARGVIPERLDREVGSSRARFLRASGAAVCFSRRKPVTA